VSQIQQQQQHFSQLYRRLRLRLFRNWSCALQQQSSWLLTVLIDDLRQSP
jgi:hypothetical protein